MHKGMQTVLFGNFPNSLSLDVTFRKFSSTTLVLTSLDFNL